MAVNLPAMLSLRNLVLISPLFLLTVKGWISAVVVILFFLAIYHLLRKAPPASFSVETRRWRIALFFALAGPLLALLAGQALRGALHLPNIDLFLRCAFAAAIFMAIGRGWLSGSQDQSIAAQWGRYVFPACMVWTFLDRPAWTQAWGDQVVTTYFVDPLTFGSICLLMALISFGALSYHWERSSWPVRLLGIAGILCGFYLSAKSGSRTGWANLPVFFAVWITFIATQKFTVRTTVLIVAAMTSVAVVAVMSQPFLVGKLVKAVNEIRTYQWNAINPDESVMMRISFYRMGLFYFLQNPMAGWGDLGWQRLMNAPEITVYASEFTREFAKNGFHNEVVTSAVRSGIWGLLSALGFLLIPLAYAFKVLRRNRYGSATYFNGFFLLVYMLHLLISGMTTEVINLIFLASFHGLVIATVAGECIRMHVTEESGTP